MAVSTEPSRRQSYTRKMGSYVGYLRTLTDRDKILQELGDMLTPEPAASSRGGSTEMFGTDFAAKTVALTFDDGPHPKYTEQVLALLRKYGIKACFFELGENLGTVDASGQREAGAHRRRVAQGAGGRSHDRQPQLLAPGAAQAARRAAHSPRSTGRSCCSTKVVGPPARPVPRSLRRAQQGDPRPGDGGGHEERDVDHRFAGLGRPHSGIHRHARAARVEPERTRASSCSTTSTSRACWRSRR